jgi:hypothetical protein
MRVSFGSGFVSGVLRQISRLTDGRTAGKPMAGVRAANDTQLIGANPPADPVPKQDAMVKGRTDLAKKCLGSACLPIHHSQSCHMKEEQ